MSDMDSVLFNEFGEDAIYNGVSLCHVVVDLNVERLNGFGEVAVNAVELTLNKKEVGRVIKGDTFKTDIGLFTVNNPPISDDGSIIVVSAS